MREKCACFRRRTFTISTGENQMKKIQILALSALLLTVPLGISILSMQLQKGRRWSSRNDRRAVLN